MILLIDPGPASSGSSVKLYCVFSIGNCCILIFYSPNLHLTSHKKCRVCPVAPAAMCQQSSSLYLILLTSARSLTSNTKHTGGSQSTWKHCIMTKYYFKYTCGCTQQQIHWQVMPSGTH